MTHAMTHALITFQLKLFKFSMTNSTYISIVIPLYNQLKTLIRIEYR